MVIGLCSLMFAAAVHAVAEWPAFGSNMDGVRNVLVLKRSILVLSPQHSAAAIPGAREP
jgi:hypothetical protein